MKSAEIIRELRTDILRLQRFKAAGSQAVDVGLGPIISAFPNHSFPVGAVHEFLVNQPEDAAATSGFVAGLLAPLMGDKGTALWISSARTLFPPALTNFHLAPDRFIFIDVREKDLLWAMEEALKCGALTAVIAETGSMNFTASRRLQLAVEQSQVTGFVLNRNARVKTTACISRWRIASMPSSPVQIGEDELPGVGFPQWRVELLRIKNGKPGVWSIRWMNGRFHVIREEQIAPFYQKKKTG